MTPWLSEWWPEIVKCAERGGHSEQEVVEEVTRGHAIGFPVPDGFLVLARTEHDEMLVWIGVGRGVRHWCGEAERAVSELARSVGCKKLKIEGRKGWQRVLPHWTRVGEHLELELSR